MEKRKFEKLGIETSLLGFGCMRFPATPDGKIDEPRAEKLLDRAIAAGVNFIRQIRRIRHHTVHKGHQLSVFKQQPEMIAICCDPLCKFFLRSRLRRREAFRLHRRNTVQIR